MPTVHFLDVTNRDGVQTARTGLSKFGKVMVNFYLARLGVAQSEIGFPFRTHEVPYVRATLALGEAGAFGPLRLSGWCRAVTSDVERAVPLGLRHYNLSISTSDQMIAHKFRGRAFGQPLPQYRPGTGRNAFAHESGIHADGALKDRHNYELYDDDTLGPFPADWHARSGRTVLTGEYGGMAGFRHVMDGLGVELGAGQEDTVFRLVQLCAAATGKSLTDDELRLIAAYPDQLSLLYPGLMA